MGPPRRYECDPTAEGDHCHRLIQPAVLETAAEGRMPAVQETVEQVRRIDVDQYKYGFVTEIESDKAPKGLSERSEEHTSELQSQSNLVCRLLLEKKKNVQTTSCVLQPTPFNSSILTPTQHHA